MESPTGILLMAYGTPETLDEVEPYYTHIRGGRKPPPEKVEELRERYRLVGGRTPLLDITRATVAGRRGLHRRCRSSSPVRTSRCTRAAKSVRNSRRRSRRAR